MVSSPLPPYDAGETRSESRPHALNASRVSTSSSRQGEHFLRAFKTLVSHEDVVRIVTRDRDGVITVTSLRRRGDEIRVTAARSQCVPSIDFSPRRVEHFFRVFQTLVSHGDEFRIVARNHDGVIATLSLRRRGDEIRVTAARSQRVPSITFLSAAERALPPAFQTLVSHVDLVGIVARNRDGVVAITSLRRRGVRSESLPHARNTS